MLEDWPATNISIWTKLFWIHLNFLTIYNTMTRLDIGIIGSDLISDNLLNPRFLVLSCNGCSIYSIVCALIIIVSFERKYWNVKKRKFWESVKDCVVLMLNTCQNYLCFQVLAICHSTDSGNLHKSVEMIKLSIMFARWNIQIQNLNKGCAWGKLLFLPIIFCLGIQVG